MSRVTVVNSWNHQTGQQLLTIRNFLLDLSNDTTEVDLTRLKFYPPLISIFFSQFIQNNPEIEFILPVSSYLNTIDFPSGFNYTNIEPEAAFTNFNNKTYLPIVKFSTSTLESEVILRNKLISQTGQMIRKITNLQTNYYSGISYLISELTDNIVEHSRASFGWIMFQYYPSEQFMDICIADSGIGILGAYQSYIGPKNFSHISTHKEAVDNMIKGASTKNLTDQERGFGVHTSREMLISGLNGKYIYLSGDALLNNYDLIDFGVASNCTLAFLRIPIQQQNTNFSVYDYTE
jgi:hypothetical protein